MSAPFHFAVIGYGYIGRRHASLAATLPGAHLAAIVEPCPAAAAQAAQQHPHVPVFSSAEALFAAHPPLRVDVACVCTPNHLHAPLALQALAAGCHAVVEKPIALCTADARAMLEAAQRHNRLLFGVMQNRYTPAAQWLKQVVASGQLGRPLLVEINCFWNRDERYYTPGGWKGRLATDGGTLFTQFSHFIDILYWVFGDIEGIAAQVANLTHPHLTDFEDTGTATFRLANGGGLGSLNFTTSVWGRNQESSLTVVAERGSLKIGGQYMNSLEYCHIDGLEPPQLAPTPPPNEYAGYQGSANNHGLLFQHVLQVLGGQAPPATNAFEGYKVVEIIERIYRAAGGNHFAPPGLTQP